MNSLIITSRQHPLCKLVRALNQPRERRRRGLFVAPGGNAVTAALAARWPLERLVVSPDDAENGWAQIAQNADVPLTLADEAILEYIGDVPSAPDVLAIARMPQEQSELPRNGLILVLDGIGDPGNIGTLIRSADAAGAAAVLTSQNSADAFGLKAVRASAGSVFHLPPLSLEDNAPEFLAARLQPKTFPLLSLWRAKGKVASIIAGPRAALWFSATKRAAWRRFGKKLLRLVSRFRCLAALNRSMWQRQARFCFTRRTMPFQPLRRRCNSVAMDV